MNQDVVDSCSVVHRQLLTRSAPLLQIIIVQPAHMTELSGFPSVSSLHEVVGFDINTNYQIRGPELVQNVRWRF